MPSCSEGHILFLASFIGRSVCLSVAVIVSALHLHIICISRVQRVCLTEEVKQRRARLVLGWVTASNELMLYIFQTCC